MCQRLRPLPRSFTRLEKRWGLLSSRLGRALGSRCPRLCLKGKQQGSQCKTRKDYYSVARVFSELGNVGKGVRNAGCERCLTMTHRLTADAQTATRTHN